MSILSRCRTLSEGKPHLGNPQYRLVKANSLSTHFMNMPHLLATTRRPPIACLVDPMNLDDSLLDFLCTNKEPGEDLCRALEHQLTVWNTQRHSGQLAIQVLKAKALLLLMETDAAQAIAFTLGEKGKCILASIALLQGKRSKAQRLLEEFIAIDWSAGFARVLLGHILLVSMQPRSAKAQLQTAVTTNPGCLKARLLLAASHLALDETAAGRDILMALLKIRPQNADIRDFLAQCFADVSSCRALAHAKIAARLEPKNHKHFTTQGLLLHSLGEFDHAREKLLVALALNRGNPRVMQALALSFYYTRNFAEALDVVERGRSMFGPLAAAPLDLLGAFIESHYGNWTKVWEYWDRRWNCIEAGFQEGRLRHREWNGSDPSSRTFIIYTEQGLGDDILFMSMARDLIRVAAHVVIVCPARLLSLYRRSFNVNVLPECDDSFKELNGRGFDYRVCSASLGRVFRLTAVDFPNTAYLSPDPDWTTALQAHYRSLARDKPVIGLAIASIARDKFGVAKTPPAEVFMDIIRSNLGLFVNLQYGSRQLELSKRAAHLGVRVYLDPNVDSTDDIDMLAAQISAVDLIVTVSTTVAHLAGALGRPALVIVPYSYPLLWLAQFPAESRWYRSVTFIRPTAPESWDDVAWRTVCAARAALAACSGI